MAEGQQLKPISVLHMIGCFEVGGSQAMVLNLLKTIDRTKVRFDFVVDNPDRMEWAGRAEALGAKIYTLPKFSGSNFLQVQKAWDRLFTEHPEYGILHSHVRSYASLYLPIAKKHGVKTIIHSHNTSNGSGIEAVAKRVLQYPLRYQADFFFGCSKVAGEWLFGKRTVESKKYHMLKNAIAVKDYQYNSEIRQQYRKELNLGTKETFIHIGRFHPAKNHSFLLETFAQVIKKKPNAMLLLVGDGDLRKDIEGKIAQWGLEKHVLLLGRRNDIPKLLQAADYFVFPSVWEGLPVTVIEAQAAGLPCVISDAITKEVALCGLVKQLPIDKGTELWVQELIGMTQERKDASEEIIRNGYDIHQSAAWLTTFYENLMIGEKESFA